MSAFSTEDTVISPNAGANSASRRNDADEAPDNRLLERCRAMFRTWGERLNSFDLSRQIYG